MGHHKVFAHNEKIPTEYINYWRDYRKYDTYAEIVAACSGFGASDMFKRFLCVADGYEYYWNGTELLRIPGSGGGGGTSNSGTASGRSPITKAHGLGGEPSEVFLTPYAVQPYAFAYNKDATNIYIYHNAAGSLTFSWRAQL